MLRGNFSEVRREYYSVRQLVFYELLGNVAWHVII